MIKGKFIDNLPKVYGIYTGGFIGFIILMAIGEQMGMSAKAIGVAFVAFTIFIYALIGYLSRTAQADAYYVAGRQVPQSVFQQTDVRHRAEARRGRHIHRVSVDVIQDYVIRAGTARYRRPAATGRCAGCPYR